MADRILEFLSNLLKIGKEQLFLKSGLLRDKVPIKPVLGLTGLGVLIMVVRPLLTSNNSADKQVTSTVSSNTDTKPKDKVEIDEENDVRRTVYLMREKEKQLRKQEGSLQKS